MDKQQIQITKYLPNFYQTNSQLTQKFGSFLANIRSHNINSYHQMAQKTLTIQLQKSFKQNIKIKNNSVKSPQKVFQNEFDQKVNKTISGFYTQRSGSKDKQQYSSRSPRIAKYSTLTPRTASIPRKKQINIGEGDIQQISDLIQLKQLMKMPFKNNPYSKIKKHLVDNINLDQIQKIFYKKPNSVSKIGNFYQKLCLKNLSNNNVKAFPVFKTNKFLNKTQKILSQKRQSQQRIQLLPQTHRTTRKKFWIRQKKVMSEKNVKVSLNNGQMDVIVAGKTFKFQYELKD